MEPTEIDDVDYGNPKGERRFVPFTMLWTIDDPAVAVPDNAPDTAHEAVVVDITTARGASAGKKLRVA